MGQTSFRVVCVCTGNVCRSPAAERLLAAALGPSVQASSAGTYALVGQPMSAPMNSLVVAAGADPRDFVASELSAPVLRQADLVLALTREHRAAAVDVAPAVVRRSFTLLEYARLLQQIDSDRLPAGSAGERARESVPLAAALRRRTGADVDDVIDPYGQPECVYEQAFDTIAEAVRQIAAIIVPNLDEERL